MSDFLQRILDELCKNLENNQRKIHHILGTDIIIDRLAMITDIYMPAMVQHQKVFPKYKGIYKGETVVITGTGPTFEHYVPLVDSIHIGINRCIFREDIKYDYIFVTDYYGQDELFEKIFSCKYKLVKFFGINYLDKDALIPEYIRNQKDVENFYIDGFHSTIYGTKFEKSRKFVYPLDLSVSPLKTYGTTFNSAFQFALWTHPRKIYIVGADCCGRGHANGLNYSELGIDYRYFIRSWRKAKEFVEAFYPDIEIISVNPVGLKGIFKDYYTYS